MHSYLRAIGFSKINNREELDKVLGTVMNAPTEKYVVKCENKIIKTEISKAFSDSMGITIRGEYDEKGFFYLEHYFPYFKGKSVSAKEELVISKRVDTDAYTGMCEDLRLGISMIFYLQNVIDYMDKKANNNIVQEPVPIILSALAISGKILLANNNSQMQSYESNAELKKKNQLITEAKKGDQDAIDSLTLNDMDLYAMISRRAKYEDIYTIVDNTFIPYGSESDNYSIIGTIISIKIVQNAYTGEWCYDMVLDCNDIKFSVCINKQDLIGEPLEGRRFKGNIWLQGSVKFRTK